MQKSNRYGEQRCVGMEEELVGQCRREQAGEYVAFTGSDNDEVHFLPLGNTVIVVDRIGQREWRERECVGWIVSTAV